MVSMVKALLKLCLLAPALVWGNPTRFKIKKTKQCWKVENNHPYSNSANIIKGNCGNHWTEKFVLVPVDRTGYLIKNLTNNKCVDVSGVSQLNHAHIHQWDCHGGGNQIVDVIRHKKGYSFRFRHSKKCLTASNSQMFDQYTCNGSNSQIFIALDSSKKMLRA